MPPRAAALRGGELGLREHLVKAAGRLVAERGAAGITVRQLAAAAGVAVGVLYNHFADKDELVALGLHEHVRTVEAGLGAEPGPAGAATLEEQLDAYVHRALALHHAIVPAFLGLFREPKVLAHYRSHATPAGGGQGLRAELADYLRAEQRLGRVAPDADVEAAAAMVIGACHELVLPHLFGGGSTSPPGGLVVPAGFVTGVVHTVLRGVSAEG